MKNKYIPNSIELIISIKGVILFQPLEFLSDVKNKERFAIRKNKITLNGNIYYKVIDRKKEYQKKNQIGSILYYYNNICSFFSISDILAATAVF